MSRRLTERDWSLLAELAVAGFLSFRQIEKTFFTGRSKATVHNRLTVLEKRGLIVRKPVGRVFHKLENRDIGVIVLPTMLTLRLVRESKSEVPLKDSLAIVSSGDLLHDLILHDTLTALRLRFPEMGFRNTKTLPRDHLPDVHLPDAIAWMDKNKKFWAVELELSAKSEKRYRQILTAYRVNPKAEKILYITAAKAIDDKLAGILAYKPRPELPRPETGKFYFADLKTFLRSPLEANFFNGRNELREPIELTPKLQQGVLHES